MAEIALLRQHKYYCCTPLAITDRELNGTTETTLLFLVMLRPG